MMFTTTRAGNFSPCLSARGPLRLYNDGVAYQPMGRLSNQDFVGRRGLLETLGNTHGLAGEKSMSLPVVAGNDLPGVDANPMSQLNAPTRFKLVVEYRECVAHLDGGAHRPQGVILVKHRHAKHGHDLVTAVPSTFHHAAG